MGYEVSYGMVSRGIFSCVIRSIDSLASYINMRALQVLFFLPETKEKTLEELDAVFNVPLRVHAKYGRKWVQKQPYSLV